MRRKSMNNQLKDHLNLKLDQHFLKDENMLNKIIEAAEIQPNDIILEIGPGKGALTLLLAKKARKVIAVEQDKSLIEFLDDLPSNVEVVYANALEIINSLNFSKLVANIPYAITEPLFKSLLRKDFELAVLLIGKSFYNSLTNQANQTNQGSKWSLISTLFFEMEKIAEVPRQCFEPIPRVDSIVIKLVKRKKELSKQEQVMKELVLQDDKKLLNALITSFARVEKLTQKQAKEKAAKLRIENKLLNKRVMHLSNRQFIIVSQIVLEESSSFRKI